MSPQQQDPETKPAVDPKLESLNAIHDALSQISIRGTAAESRHLASLMMRMVELMRGDEVGKELIPPRHHA